MRTKLDLATKLVFLVAFAFLGFVFTYKFLYEADKPTPQITAAPSITKETITPDGLLLAINNVRKERGLQQLAPNPLLSKSATAKCTDMENAKYYAHKNPTTGKAGNTYIVDVGYKYNYGSENLNAGSFNSAEEVLDNWLESETHKAAILDVRVTETGFAICKVPPFDLVFVNHLAQPASTPAQSVAPQPRYNYSRNLYETETTTCTSRPSYANHDNTVTTRCETN